MKPRYYALHGMTDKNMTCAITDKDLEMEDERITAWDTIVRHPFFNKAFDNSYDKPLIDAMLEILDAAVEPITNEGEKMTEIFRATDKDNDSLWLSTVGADYERGQGYSLHARTYGPEGAYLTLKDVAALHKALGDHLEANKRTPDTSVPIRFPNGDVAVYGAEIPCWYITGFRNKYTTEELLEEFGTDWEELVVK